jgi:5'-phosphate synthase pdxT subunit
LPGGDGKSLKKVQQEMKIGILALQGAVREHANSLRGCGAEPVEIRYPEQLSEVKGLIIPGGESTTVGKLLIKYQMLEPIAKLGREGFPIFGTCTGLILLAKDIIGSDQPRLGLMDIAVERNAFGRQIASFEQDIPVADLGVTPFHAIFIRAPYITKAGPEAKVMARLDQKILLVREQNFLAAAFHPELTSDLRIHQYFLKMC